MLFCHDFPLKEVACFGNHYKNISKRGWKIQTETFLFDSVLIIKLTILHVVHIVNTILILDSYCSKKRETIYTYKLQN